MKKYSEDILNGFNKSSNTIERFGFAVEIKDIPDTDKPGSLDPRELPYAEAFFKNNKGSSAQQGIEGIRRATGYVNYNINTVEIITDCIDVERDGRKIRVWIYYPRKPFDISDRAGFIYIHGGSFFAGSPFVCENTCRCIAERANCVVFNIDYALAPEHPFPEGYKDCKAVLDYVYENAEKHGVDRNKLCIGGDSAGASLAASVSVCDTARRIKFNVLYYPSTTFRHDALPFKWDINDYEMCDEQRSLIEPKLCLGRADGKGDDMLMLMIKQIYLQHGEDPSDPAISPLNGDFTGLGRTLIITSEYDGLRYHGEYMAALLNKAGVSTRALRYRGVFHAFMDKIGVLPQAEDAINETAKEMNALFG